MSTVGDVAMVVGGIALTLVVVDSAVRTFILPRAVVSALTRIVFLCVRGVFGAFARETRTYEARDRVMALYAPLGLVALVGTWMTIVVGAYTLLFRALITGSWKLAFELSGSSFFTLGFRVPAGSGEWGFVLSFTEAAAGLAILALL